MWITERVLLLLSIGIALSYSLPSEGVKSEDSGTDGDFGRVVPGANPPPVANVPERIDGDFGKVVDRDAHVEWKRTVHRGHLAVDRSKRHLAVNRSKRRALKQSVFYWSSRVVPYQISGVFSNADKTLIRSALDDWSAKTCVTFREKQSSDSGWVRVEDPATAGTCNALQGKSPYGGKQVINISKKGCLWFSTILHEVGHTLSLSHEHQHPHRDNYLTLVTQNVKPDSLEWMTKLQADDHNYFGLDFDMDSVMTYGSWSNAIGSERTLLTKDPSLQHRLDNYHKELSYSDAAIINKMLKCDELCATPKSCPADSYLDKNCNCITPQVYYDTWCKDTAPAGFDCFDAAATGRCTTADVAYKCMKTCDFCPMYHLQRKGWATDGSCQNKFYLDEMCTAWAQAGHCTNTKYRKYMVVQCSKACNTCDVDPECLDTLECDGYDPNNCKAGSQWYPFMMANCKNWCGAGPSTCPVELKPCEDKISCDGYDKAYCEDGNRYLSFMKENCWKWCGFCDASQTTAAVVTTTPTPVCEDKMDCRVYNIDFCKKESIYHTFMMDKCKKYCNGC